MNKFESPNLESSDEEPDEEPDEESDEEYEDLIKYHEDLIAQEALKEKVECGPHIKEFEAMLIPLLKEELLTVLNSIETEEEVLNSEEWDFAKEALIPLVDKMNFLKKRTNITDEEYGELHKKYKIISHAVGMVNQGIVDHNR